MQYDKIEFSECLFFPFEKERMLDVYPILKQIVTEKNIKDEKNIDFLIRYVVLLYDNKSPLLRKERDLSKRKQIAAELSGLNGLGEDYLNEVYLNKNIVVLEISSKYLFNFIKIKEYSALIAFEYKYNENITELLTPIVGETNAERLDAAKKKSVISVEIINDIKVIDMLWDDIFTDKDLLKTVKNKRISPESIS